MVLGTGTAVGTAISYFIAPLFPGIAISISAVKRKGVAVLVFVCNQHLLCKHADARVGYTSQYSSLDSCRCGQHLQHTGRLTN
mgnify:CR=1 FL=1